MPVACLPARACAAHLVRRIPGTASRSCVAVAAAAGIGLGAPAATPSGAGVGITAVPVCDATPIRPGTSAAIEGLAVYDTGTSSENIAVSVRQLGTGSELSGYAYPVPPSWVRIGYPRLLWVIGRSSVSVSPGGGAGLGVTVSVPADARRGAYAAYLDAETVTRHSGGLSLGAAAVTYLLFTVGITKPSWPPRLSGLGCWAKPGQRVPWQEWAGTSYTTPPPGWHWSASDGSWAYTPPPGWVWDWWLNPARQVYRGARPLRPCLSAAAVARFNAGRSQPLLGGGYLDSSSAAGCARWLKASAGHTLGEEPAIGPARSPRPASVAGPATSTSAAPAGRSSLTPITGLAAAVAIALGVWRWRRRRWR